MKNSPSASVAFAIVIFATVSIVHYYNGHSFEVAQIAAITATLYAVFLLSSFIFLSIKKGEKTAIKKEMYFLITLAILVFISILLSGIWEYFGASA